MNFAWVRFYKKKFETCLPISDIGVKQKLPNGSPQIVSFHPKGEENFLPNKWHFAQEKLGNSSKDDNLKWSRIVILYLGATREDIYSKKESDQRKKYVNPKCINSESSFEDPSRSTSQSNKKVNTERAKNVLRRIENQFEVPHFEDFIENNNVETGTTTQLKNAVVFLKKLDAAESTSVSDTSPPGSPSLLDTRKRKSSWESEPPVNRKIPRSNHSVSPTLFDSYEELQQSPTHEGSVSHRLFRNPQNTSLQRVQSSRKSSSEQNETPHSTPPRRQEHEEQRESPQDDLPSVQDQPANENQIETQDASAEQPPSNQNEPRVYRAKTY